MSGGVVYAGGGTALQRALKITDTVDSMPAELFEPVFNWKPAKMEVAKGGVVKMESEARQAPQPWTMQIRGGAVQGPESQGRED